MSAPFEPSAETRIAARQWRNLYDALLAERFTPWQALYLLGQVVSAASATAGGKPPQ